MAALVSGLLVGGKYRVLRPLGTGGMGAVYEVENAVLGGRAALKVLTLSIEEHPELFTRFQNEARAANQTGHPGVVPVYDFGQLPDGTPWLVMPLLVGESLAHRLRQAPAGSRTALGLPGLWVIGDIASALGAAHAHGIIHRDLKPANVMLVSDPSTMSGERAMVLDFGVAKLRSDELTKRGAMLGTPVYMALEQFRDSATVDGKADVFSLGCIAYQLLSGELPHHGSTHYELMGKLDPHNLHPSTRLLILVQPSDESEAAQSEALTTGTKYLSVMRSLVPTQSKLRLLGPFLLPCRLRGEVSRRYQGPMDSPVPGEPADKIKRIRVWAFRTDC